MATSVNNLASNAMVPQIESAYTFSPEWRKNRGESLFHIVLPRFSFLQNRGNLALLIALMPRARQARTVQARAVREWE